MKYNYKLDAFSPATLGGYRAFLESPWGEMEVFNISPKVRDYPRDEKLLFNLTKDDIRYFEIESFFGTGEFLKMDKFVDDFYDNERLYEKSKKQFAIYNKENQGRIDWLGDNEGY